MATPSNTVLRLPAVIARCGLCGSSIYARIQSGEFPRPIRIGKRAVGWLESEVESWLAEKVKASRPAKIRPAPKAQKPAVVTT